MGLIFTPINRYLRSLAAGNSCEIYVLFFAANMGSLAATLNILNNGIDSPQMVPLSATVTHFKY